MLQAAATAEGAAAAERAEEGGEESSADISLLVDGETDDDVDRAVGKHQRGLSTRRQDARSWLAQQQNLPTAQTPFVTEADCALFHELLPRFLPTGRKKTVDAEGLTKAFNTRVADEYFALKAGQTASCNEPCCSAIAAGREPLRGCTSISAQMKLSCKTVLNVTDYITKVAKLIGTQQAIEPRVDTMKELSN